MSVAYDQYGTPVDVDITLDSLGTGAYNESATIVDVGDTLVARTLQIAFQFTVAAAGLSAGTITIWLAKRMPAATTAPAIMDGNAAGAKTADGSKSAHFDTNQMDVVAVIPTDTDASRVYSGSALIDGVPPGSTLVVMQNSGASLAASGNDISVRQVPVSA